MDLKEFPFVTVGMSFGNFVEDVDNHLDYGYLLYQKEYQLDKDLLGGNIYSLENCVVISAVGSRRISYIKQQRKVLAISATEKIKFDSVSETSRQLNIKRTTLIGYLNNGKQHDSGYSFKCL